MSCFAGAGLLGRMGQRMVVFDQDALGLVRMQSAPHHSMFGAKTRAKTTQARSTNFTTMSDILGLQHPITSASFIVILLLRNLAQLLMSTCSSAALE